jgi:signal transduction histidine kinase
VKKIDIALAVGLTAWMVAEVWAENLQPAGVTIPLTIVAGASLAWRRLYPIPVALLVTAVSIAEAAAGMTLHSAVSPVVALFLVSWSIGAYEDRRRAILGLTLLVSGVWVSMAVDMLRGTDHYVGTDFPWIGALVLAPGVLGIAFGARTRSLRAAEARTQLLELERREAIASERARIARELHDVIAHSVSVMTVQAGAAEEMLKTDPARAFEPVRAIQDTGRGALVEMKRLVGVLRDDDEDVGLAPQPGLGDVERLLEQMRNAGLEVDLRIEGAERPVPPGVDLSAYRVIQEALTNTLKHTGGAPAIVTVRFGDDALEVEVTDAGSGAPARRDSGHGLVGMRERVGIFGGTFDAGPGAAGGFVVRALLPLDVSA